MSREAAPVCKRHLKMALAAARDQHLAMIKRSHDKIVSRITSPFSATVSRPVAAKHLGIDDVCSRHVHRHLEPAAVPDRGYLDRVTARHVEALPFAAGSRRLGQAVLPGRRK